MARNFKDLQAKMSPERRARSEEAAQKMVSELPLAELREALKMTQVELAKKLKVDQGSVSKLEHRADMYVSTLRDVIRAMGGELELTARFPKGEIHIIALAKDEERELVDAG